MIEDWSDEERIAAFIEEHTEEVAEFSNGKATMTDEFLNMLVRGSTAAELERMANVVVHDGSADMLRKRARQLREEAQ